MIRWVSASWMRNLLAHPRADEVMLGLIGLGVAVSAFEWGREQSALEREQRRLRMLDQRVDSWMESHAGTLLGRPFDAEEVIDGFVDGVEGGRVWIDGLRRVVEAAGFRMRLRCGAPVRPSLGLREVAHVDVTVELESPSKNPDAVVRVEGILDHLGMEGPPFELQRVRWSGSGSGLSGVVLEGRLWIRDPKA